ncbi:WD-40 repeat-containing protein, partial [Reticulomyxa filosa]
INDIICEWIDAKEIKKIANRYISHSEIRILKPPQLKETNEEEEINIKNNIIFKLTKFVYDQLCQFNPKETKGKAVYVVLFEYFKKHIMGEMNPVSCADVISLLKESRKRELEEDITMSQALETYIPLQANNYPFTDNDDNKKNDLYDCNQYIIDSLTKEKEEKKSEKQKQQVIVLQGKSGSGKSLFCRHLEETLWELYVNGSTASIPVYISLSKCFNELNGNQIISQALQMKNINKEIIDAVRENISFVFILDGFDEIFDKYNNERYFYEQFNLNEWNAKIIVTCRSHVLNDEDVQHVLIGSKNITTTSMIYLWPFSKEQMNGYIDKFVKMNKKNKMNDNQDWTIQQYEETLNNFPNLHKMMEEPFLLRMILTVLPSLTKQHPIGTKISKSQVYEAFNEQWIDIHVKNITNKLSELRIQTNPRKIKFAFQQYCQNLGFEMFMQGNQVATESDYNENVWSQLDPTQEMDIKNEDSKTELKMNETTTSSSSTQTMYLKRKKKTNDDKNQNVNENVKLPITKAPDMWEKYFNGDSVTKYVLRRVGDNKYQFLHRSCQEYYAAQKIIFDIISWKPNIANIDNQQFQQQFEEHVQKLLINCKLLNEELGIIHFIVERIDDLNPIFVNLKSRLFRIIESSKNNENVNIAAANAITILNSANVNMHNRNWNHAFLEGTNFSNANLDHAHFYQTCLTKVNFTNTSMNNIYFGEYAYLEGHSDAVKGIQFSPDGTKILSYSSDKTIRIWDTLSRKQLHVLEGHSDTIHAVQFSHDGSKIVSCSLDKTIRIWDALSGQQLQLLKGHSYFVSLVEFSSDDSKIVSCSSDYAIRIWEVSSGKQIKSLDGHLSWVFDVKFSPDDSKIVSCSEDKTIRIWDVSSGKQLLLLKGHTNEVTGVQFISNGSKIISYSYDKTIRIWDALSGQQLQLLKEHTNDINGIQLSPDDLTILSYSSDKTIRIWDLLSGKQLQVLELSSDVKKAKFSFDGSRIASGLYDNTIRLWDVSSGKQIQVLEGHSSEINGVEFFPNESKILSCSKDKTIRIWDISLERKIQLTEGYIDVIRAVEFSPDGSKIVSGSVDKTVRLWDVQSGRQIQVFEGHLNTVDGVLFSPDGSKIVSYSLDKTIRIWDVLLGKQLQLLEGHSAYINKVRFSPDGSKIVSCSDDKTIQIWDISSGRQIGLLNGHSSNVTEAQFLSDGNKVISCSWDKTIRLWDTLSGRQTQTFEGHTNFVEGIKLSSDSSKLASYSSDKTIRVWDISSGKQLFLFKENEHVTEIQFSPDGTTIASCFNDRTIRLWNVLTGKQIQILKGHSDYIQGTKFSLDGSKIISCSWDKTIRIWDVFSGKDIQVLEGHNGRITVIDLSPDGSKIVSCSGDKTIRLWNIDNDKTVNVTETSMVHYIWRAGIQSGLSMKDSIWKDAKGLEDQQILLVKQRGGLF